MRKVFPELSSSYTWGSLSLFLSIETSKDLSGAVAESGNGRRMTTLAGLLLLRELHDVGLNRMTLMTLPGLLLSGERLATAEFSPDLVRYSPFIWSTE